MDLRIAAALRSAVPTRSSQHAFAKIGVRNRAEAARYAFQHDLAHA
jgi:DNA-binding NarL/FixJ family response regulator